MQKMRNVNKPDNCSFIEEWFFDTPQFLDHSFVIQQEKPFKCFLDAKESFLVYM